jgi:hypothetical protein
MSGERLDLVPRPARISFTAARRHTPLRARPIATGRAGRKTICLSTSPDVITIGKDGRMNQPTDDPLVSELEQASIDLRRVGGTAWHEAAAHKRGLIQSETRQHGLDDS